MEIELKYLRATHLNASTKNAVDLCSTNAWVIVRSSACGGQPPAAARPQKIAELRKPSHQVWAAVQQ